MESRYRAARQVNKEVLALNFSIGRFISLNTRSAKWGINAVAVISKLLQQELPGVKGYSEASIKMMRIFYEEWESVFENRQSTIDDFANQLVPTGLFWGDRDTSKPMVVATYRTSQELLQKLREALPSMEGLKKLL